MAELLGAFAAAAGKKAPDVDELAASLKAVEYPAPLARQSTFLTHPVFHLYRSEHELLRYIRRLEARDLSLTTSMIPLGSCTMKLNATTEMIPVTWPEFGRLHPFAPAEQAAGYDRAVLRSRGLAGRDHRLRGGVAAAERGRAGRVRRAARHPRLPCGRAARSTATCASSRSRPTAPTRPAR